MSQPRFYDLNVHSRPDGNTEPEQMASIAGRIGYSGIAITNHSSSKDAVVEVDTPGIEVFRGVELMVSNASKLHGLVGKYRNKVDVLVVHGGNEDVNRAAVENPNVDVLAHPQTSRDGGINHVLARSASENNVAIGFNMDTIIKGRGGRRVQTLSHFRKNLELVRKYDVPMLLTSNAASRFDMRAPREMIALAGLFGMRRDEAIDALSRIPEQIINHNRLSAGPLCEGVDIIKEETLSEGEFL
ncbi:MAG: ribonuclease P protein component 3 [Euryarchaeota archaeon]|nr:ribonuclease P protein component 3 [Euryarchaeota archaeon]